MPVRQKSPPTVSSLTSLPIPLPPVESLNSPLAPPPVTPVAAPFRAAPTAHYYLFATSLLSPSAGRLGGAAGAGVRWSTGRRLQPFVEVSWRRTLGLILYDDDPVAAALDNTGALNSFFTGTDAPPLNELRADWLAVDLGTTLRLRPALTLRLSVGPRYLVNGRLPAYLGSADQGVAGFTRIDPVSASYREIRNGANDLLFGVGEPREWNVGASAGLTYEFNDRWGIGGGYEGVVLPVYTDGTPAARLGQLYLGLRFQLR